MPNVVFVQPDGSRVVVDVRVGDSAMRAAVSGGVEGIIAECGGSAMCATCHVYVDENFLDQLPKMSLDEDALLDSTASPRKPNSRLSCQIRIEDAFDGSFLLFLRLRSRASLVGGPGAVGGSRTSRAEE